MKINNEHWPMQWMGRRVQYCTHVNRSSSRAYRTHSATTCWNRTRKQILKEKTRIIRFNAIVTIIRNRPSRCFDSDMLTTRKDATTVNYRLSFVSADRVLSWRYHEIRVYLILVSQIRSPRVVRVT